MENFHKLNTKSILDLLDCDCSDFEETFSDDEDRNMQEDLLYRGRYAF